MAIAKQFDLPASRCPLLSTALDDHSRIMYSESTLWTLNYKAFSNSANVLNQELVDKNCKGLLGLEIYYTPDYPDRFLAENTMVNTRKDDLYGFLYVSYTD